MRKFIIIFLALATLAGVAGNRKQAHRLLCAQGESDTSFTVTFLTGATPSSISLNASYAGPGTPSLAEYDAGDGVWETYTSNTISIVGNYIKFRGDWRNSAGSYAYMFRYTLQSDLYTCKFSGHFDYQAQVANAYREMFRGSSAVTKIEDNPLPVMTGSCYYLMLYYTFAQMTGVADSLPDGFLDTSGLSGVPAGRMLYAVCSQLSATGSLPDNFLNTSNLTGAPASEMFRAACHSMFNITGDFPDGFLSSANMSGAPSKYMYYFSCYNMQKITGGDLVLGAGLTLTSANVVTTLSHAFRNLPNWTGQCYWGTNVLVEAIPIPDSDANTFIMDTNMPNYDTIDANWK